MSANGSRHVSPERNLTCCIIENDTRCTNRASNTTFSKKMKSLAQKKQSMFSDQSVSSIFLSFKSGYEVHKVQGLFSN